MFDLDPRLARDTLSLGKTHLCRVLLMNDARFPWLILVPERPHVVEPFDLPESDQTQLWQESMHLARTMKRYFSADKLNVASLGNQVTQLHIHHIARFHDDAAWPRPVWGVGTPECYSNEKAILLLDSLRLSLMRHPLLGFSEG